MPTRHPYPGRIPADGPNVYDIVVENDGTHTVEQYAGAARRGRPIWSSSGIVLESSALRAAHIRTYRMWPGPGAPPRTELPPSIE